MQTDNAEDRVLRFAPKHKVGPYLCFLVVIVLMLCKENFGGILFWIGVMLYYLWKMHKATIIITRKSLKRGDEEIDWYFYDGYYVEEDEEQKTVVVWSNSLGEILKFDVKDYENSDELIKAIPLEQKKY